MARPWILRLRLEAARRMTGMLKLQLFFCSSNRGVFNVTTSLGITCFDSLQQFKGLIGLNQFYLTLLIATH